MPQHSRPKLPLSTSFPPRSFWLAEAAAHIALHVFLLARRPIPREWPGVEKLGMTMTPEVMSPRAKAALTGVGHLA